MDIPGLYHLDFAFDVKDLRDGDDNCSESDRDNMAIIEGFGFEGPKHMREGAL